MRSLALPVAAAALLALTAVAALQALRPVTPTTAEQARAIAAELRCPDCEGLSVAESHTLAGGAIRAEIAEQLAAGRSAEEIRQHFVARYGEWILLAPTNPVAWWLPGLVVAAGAGLFGWWWLRGRRRSDARASVPPISEAERRRIREAAEQLDD